MFRMIFGLVLFGLDVYEIWDLVATIQNLTKNKQPMADLAPFYALIALQFVTSIFLLMAGYKSVKNSRKNADNDQE